jgi:hypothetical protein
MLSLDPMTDPISTSLRQALGLYKRKTGKELLDHPLATELKQCSSVDAIIEILQGQASAFQRFRDSDRRVMKWISPIVDVLYKLCDTLRGDAQGAAGMVRTFVVTNVVSAC